MLPQPVRLLCSVVPSNQLPRFSESILISCGLADAFSDYFELLIIVSHTSMRPRPCPVNAIFYLLRTGCQWRLLLREISTLADGVLLLPALPALGDPTLPAEPSIDRRAVCNGEGGRLQPFLCLKTEFRFQIASLRPHPRGSDSIPWPNEITEPNRHVSR